MFLIENLEYIMLLLLFLNLFHIKKFKTDKLLLYKKLQKDSIILSFFYLIGASLLCLANNRHYLNIFNISFSLIIVLLFPLILTLLSNIPLFNFFTSSVLNSKLTKLFNIICNTVVVVTCLFHLFFKEHYLNKYCFSILLFLFFLFITINYNDRSK